MKYTVVLTEKTDGNIHVTVPGLPECIVEAHTRDEALEKTRETIAEIVSRSEIFQLDVSAVPKYRNLHLDTPWEWFGRFKDNPTWGEMFDEIGQQKNSDWQPYCCHSQSKTFHEVFTKKSTCQLD